MPDEVMNWILDSAKLILPFGMEVADCGIPSDMYSTSQCGMKCNQTTWVLRQPLRFMRICLKRIEICLSHWINIIFQCRFRLPVTSTTIDQLINMESDLMPSDQGL